MLEKVENLSEIASAGQVLTSSQLASWEKNGFLVLKGFFDEDVLKAYDEEVNLLMHNRATMAGDITIDVLEGHLTGQRLKLKDAPDVALESAHKINDLFLESPKCRDLNLAPKLCQGLEDILGDKPLIINSLTFRKGSQQPHHFDTYFMPPPVQNMMAVTSICLEDQSPEVGILSYYPGSHKIPPYVFSHGSIAANMEEMDKATEFAMTEIKKLGLKEETFTGKAGDVFIWHSQLYHGGLQIEDHSKTRKTLVTHYWRKQDVDQSRVATAENGGHYMTREHQSA